LDGGPKSIDARKKRELDRANETSHDYATGKKTARTLGGEIQGDRTKRGKAKEERNPN